MWVLVSALALQVRVARGRELVSDQLRIRPFLDLRQGAAYPARRVSGRVCIAHAGGGMMTPSLVMLALVGWSLGLLFVLTLKRTFDE